VSEWRQQQLPSASQASNSPTSSYAVESLGFTQDDVFNFLNSDWPIHDFNDLISNFDLPIISPVTSELPDNIPSMRALDQRLEEGTIDWTTTTSLCGTDALSISNNSPLYSLSEPSGTSTTALSAIPLGWSLSTETATQGSSNSSNSSAQSINSPTKRSHSDISDDAESAEQRQQKRQRNTEAARRYRQRKVDQVASFEDQLAAVTKERDELRLKLARSQAEVEVLRGVVGGKRRSGVNQD